MSYAYQGEFNEDVNAKFADWLNEKLIALQDEADPVLCEYVTTMVANRKTMGEMSSDLAEFFGEDEREQFITSLEEKLLSLEVANGIKEEDDAPTASKKISLSSSSAIDHAALSKPLGAGRESGAGGKTKGDKSKGKQGKQGKQPQQQQEQRGSRPNRLLQAAMEQGKTGKKRGNDQGDGFNKRARSNNNDQGMNTMAQMQGFNNANEMMFAYQQNMMTMMQSVLAPVMEATKGLVGTRGGRGFVRGGRGGFPPRGRGRGGRFGAGRGGEAGSSSTEGGDAGGESTTAGEGGDESTASKPQDGFVGNGTFDMTSGYRGRGGRGFRGRGRFSGRISARGGRGRGRAPTGPVNKVWKREPDVESSLTTGR